MGGDKKIVVSFLDRVAPKNKLQIDVIHELGHHAFFFANAYVKQSRSYFNSDDGYEVLVSGLFARLKQVYHFFKKNKQNVHHVEVYPGGRFAFLYLLIARYFGLKVICVERGDLLYFKKGGYDWLTRLSMWVCYKMSHLVWYREVYMEPVLRTMGVKKRVFIHNAIDISKTSDTPGVPFNEKKIDFLWVNRLIPERRSDWFVDILNTPSFANTKNVLAGVLKQTLYQAQQDYVTAHNPPNLELVEFVADPSSLYKEAKFFVLPAKVVFANNALLEAMSYGVVPIIVDSPGYELIVSDQVNGIVSTFGKNEFEKAMSLALNMDPVTYQKMSQAAKYHISEAFSASTYKTAIAALYKQIEL